MKDTEGNPNSVVITFRDISELKRAEEERAKALSEAAAAKTATEILESTPEGITILNLNWNVLESNPTARRMMGYKESQVGEPLIKFIAERDVPRGMEAMKEFMRTGVSKTFECNAARADGTEFPASVEAAFLRDAEGKPNRIMLTFRDITDLKRAEEERVAAFKRAADTIEAMIEPVIIYDLEGKVMQVNKAIEAYGYTKEELIGKYTPDLLIPERDRSRVANGFKKALENGSITRDVEVTLLTKDGKEVPFLISGMPLRDQNGKQIRRIEILKDISRLRHLEEREAAAAAADKARIEELEKFARLTTGREQRIIELKRRVAELEEKLKAK